MPGMSSSGAPPFVAENTSVATTITAATTSAATRYQCRPGPTAPTVPPDDVEYDIVSYSPGVETSEPTGVPGRRVVVLLGAAVVVVVGYFATGMPGMDHGADGAMGAMDMSAPAPPALDPQAFARRLADGEALLVDVHEPLAASVIEGTDDRIPAREVTQARGLDGDLDRRILLYCRTGRMAADAAYRLAAAGYTDVAYLRGGIEAWDEAGLPLVPARTAR